MYSYVNNLNPICIIDVSSTSWLALPFHIRYAIVVRSHFNMALQTEPAWKTLFQSLNIAEDASTAYAAAFIAGGITETTLPHLDKETLTELGVNVIGHRLLILNHIKTSSSTTSTKATVNAKLSTLTSEMTQSQFRQFLTDWKVYKQLVNLQPQQLVPHLYNACDDTVRNAITNLHPDILTKSEEQALETV